MTRVMWLGSGPKTAMVAALALPWLGWAWPAAAAVLVLTWSWLAFLAVSAGLLVQHPAWWLPIGSTWALVMGLVLASPMDGNRRKRLLEWTPRGGNLRTMQGRWTAIQLALLTLTVWGHGPGSMGRALRRWHSRGARYLPTDALFCGPLQLTYEYGVFGALAVGLAVGAAVVTWQWDTRWAATMVTFAVCTGGHAPVFYLRRWVARQARRLVPEPPLLADLTIHVCHDGTFRLYHERPDDRAPLTLTGWAAISAAILRAGMHVAETHGLTPEQIGLES